MQLHHAKHHQAYVTNLNVAEEKIGAAQQKSDLAGTVAQLKALNFNGGGHLNHSIFWQNLIAPKEYADPSGTIYFLFTLLTSALIH